MKKCTKCGECKELSEFCRHAGKSDGLKSHCKQCEAEYRANNREKIQARSAEWRKNNRDKERGYCKNWRQKYPDKQKEILAKKVANLTKSYIATDLKIKVSKVTDELFELKRAQLEIYRLTNQLNKEIQNGTE